MNAPHRLTMTGEEYLAWEARQERKHELVNGVVRLMAGGTVAHNTLTLNCAVALRAQLKGGPCKVFVADMKVRTRNGFRYPDVSVDCGSPNSKDLFADKPTILVEVLSPSTEWFDETDKLDEYRAIPSVDHVVLLSQRRPFARIWTREGENWRTQDADGTDAEIVLSALGLRLTMSDVYDGVEFGEEGLDEPSPP